jgi:hypothetical protein
MHQRTRRGGREAVTARCGRGSSTMEVIGPPEKVITGKGTGAYSKRYGADPLPMGSRKGSVASEGSSRTTEPRSAPDNDLPTTSRLMAAYSIPLYSTRLVGAFGIRFGSSVLTLFFIVLCHGREQCSPFISESETQRSVQREAQLVDFESL